MRAMQSAVASAEEVARAATVNVWAALLKRAGLDRRGAMLWSAPGGTGTVKLTPLHSRGVLGVFVNGVPGFEGRPFDAPAFAVAFLGMSWPEALAHVMALAAEDRAGPDGAAEGPSPALPPSGRPVSPELRALADRMSATGVPIDSAALDAALAKAETHGPPDLHRQLSRLRRSLGPDGRLRPVWQPEGAISGRWTEAACGILDLAKPLRHLVGTRDGAQLVHADLVAADLVAHAALTADSGLLTLAAEPDPYRALAAFLLDLGVEAVSDELRAAFKAFASRTFSGAGRRSQEEALAPLASAVRSPSAIRASWHARFPGVDAWHAHLHERARASEPIRLPSSDRRLATTPTDTAGALSARASQALVVDHVNASMLEIERRLMDGDDLARIVLQHHDAVLVEATDDHVPNVIAILRDTLQRRLHAGTVEFGFRIAISVGRSWASLHQSKARSGSDV